MADDVSHLIRVKNGVPDREPIPAYLVGLPVSYYADLSWADASYGLAGVMWLPPDDKTPALGRFQQYGPGETLTYDAARGVVVVVREVITLPNLSRRLSRFALRNRFTATERIAVERAAQDDPQADDEARNTAAALRAYLGDLDAVSYVDLDHPTTVAGLALLTAAGIVTTERADAIRAAEVSIAEEP